MNHHDALQIARQNLLEPAELTEQQLERILGGIVGRHVDNADRYFQAAHSESWVLEDGLVKQGSYNIERGVGVWAMYGEKIGFAYSDDIILPALEQAANAARHGRALKRKPARNQIASATVINQASCRRNKQYAACHGCCQPKK